MGSCVTTYQAKVVDLIFSAQKNHSTNMPNHVLNTGTEPDAQNAPDSETIEMGSCVTTYQVKVVDLIFSAQMNTG